MKPVAYLPVLLMLFVSCSSSAQGASSRAPTVAVPITSTQVTPASTLTPGPTPTPTPSPTPTLRPIEEFQLSHFLPLALDYTTNDWAITQVGTYHWLGLGHRQIAGCYLREQGGTDVSIEFVSTTRLGKIAYSIYAWAGGEPESYGRMYFADDSSLVSESNYKPAFSVSIPYSAEKECISEVEEVLATLHDLSQ